MKLKIITGIMLTLLTLSIVIVFMGEALLPSVTAQTNPTATVYLDPPIINGSEIGVGQNFTVNLNIVDAVNIYAWQAGLIFNATVVECLNYMEGEFLSENGAKQTYPAAVLTINNTLGIIEPYGWTILGNYPPTNGSGTLGYLKFRVKALGVSDMHLQDVKAVDWVETSPGYWEKINIPLKIIDVYTVFVDTTPHTVVTVSNSTGLDTIWVGGELVTVHSGFYDHAFNASAGEISFKVTGPYPGFSNVTIPKALLEPEPSYGWGVIVDGLPASRTVTENATHTSIYFTYSSGTHEAHITTARFISSNISITLSSTNITVGSNITIFGGIVAADATVRPGVNVTIQYRPSGGTWTTLAIVITEWDGTYSYIWKPKTNRTYEVMASWEGDATTVGAVSEVCILTVLGPGLVHNINTTLNYCTIQEAIDAPETEDGDTILVDGGTYVENVVVHKSISLIGENRDSIIDGNEAGTVVTVTADNVNITGFTIQNSGTFDCGILFSESNGNFFGGNTILDNDIGVELFFSSNNILKNNNITRNIYNFVVSGYYEAPYGYEDWLHNIDETNTVDGKPIYYWINQRDKQIPINAGCVYLINSINITVKDVEVAHNGGGVTLVVTDNSTIENVKVSTNYCGIWLTSSAGNRIIGNTITNSEYAILLDHSANNTVIDNVISNNSYGIILYSSDFEYTYPRPTPNNNLIVGNTISNSEVAGIFLPENAYSHNSTIYHNNFTNNTKHVDNYDSVNFWDNGLEGNCWSDYPGVDANMDGIGDSSYEIDSNNIDHYPLMGTFSDFPVTLEEAHHITTVCNSTISAFEFDQVNRIIRFNVTGEEGIGFCRVCIPHALMEPPYTVTIDGLDPLYVNYTLCDNSTHTWIYFTYQHSTHEVEIIPEFPTTIILPLFMFFTLIAVAITKKIAIRRKIYNVGYGDHAKVLPESSF